MREDAYQHCAALVHDADKDRFFAALFAPVEARPHLYALYAFNVEISRIREATHSALPGEMRLQWWRDVLAGRGYGEVSASPVAAALLDTLSRFDLPDAPLVALLDARSFDLYQEPMQNMAELEAYVRATSATTIQFAAAILAGGDKSAAGIEAVSVHAGAAYGVAMLLRALPAHAARRQLFIPIEMLQRHGADAESIFAGEVSPGLHASLAELREIARSHLLALRERLPEIPAECAPAFLIAALVEPMLARMERLYYDPFAPIEFPQWRRQWALWRATWGGILSL